MPALGARQRCRGKLLGPAGAMVAMPVAPTTRDAVARTEAPQATSSTNVDVMIALLGALVIVAPFELPTPWLTLPGQALSNVEAALAVVLTVWLTLVSRQPRQWTWPSPVSAPLGLFVVLAFCSAMLAPSLRANAAHMAARLALMSVLVLVVSSTVDRLTDLRRLMAAATAGGVLVSVLTILEYAGLADLRPFHSSVALVGAQVRASGPLQYPTLASMFLEICFSLGLGLALASSRSAPRAAAGYAAALVLIAEAIILTFTRSGLITVAIALLLSLWAAVTRRTVREAWPVLVVGAAFLLLVATSRSAEALRARLATEGQGRWYQAAYDAPPRLALTTGTLTSVRLTVRNEGRITWSSDDDHPFHLSYHWLTEDGEEVVSWEEERTRFDGTVPPGASAEIHASVLAPDEPGRYRLAWDIEVTNRLWFSTEPEAAAAYSVATVTGQPPAVAAKTRRGGRFPARAYRPGRQELWSIAVGLWRERPLLGIGQDNFRLLSGSANPRSDPRVHTNNMYLELFVGTGLLGAAALVWLGVRVAGVLRNLLASRAGESLGIAAAVIAILVHGLVDAFLAFTPLYVLIALTAGLAVSASRMADRHAHRL